MSTEEETKKEEQPSKSGEGGEEAPEAAESTAHFEPVVSLAVFVAVTSTGASLRNRSGRFLIQFLFHF